MPSLCVCSLGLALAAGPAQSDVFIRVPFVRVQVQHQPQPVVVPAEPVPAPGAVVPLPAPNVVTPAPAIVPPPLAPSAVVRPLTLNEFAASFQPAPGQYEVTLLHPVTGAPVHVAFTLPDGAPRKVRVYKRELEFDYGRHEVSIRFKPDGRVVVRSH
jgi:hypothetical protein